MNTQTKGESINSQITLMMKSGQATIGAKQVLKKLRTNQLKGILYSSNLPILKKKQIQYYSRRAGVAIREFQGNNTDLGTACGKLFRVGIIGVISPGDSQIMTYFPKEAVQSKTPAVRAN